MLENIPSGYHWIRPGIEKRISIARGTMYSLMGAGLHGINGINPLIAWKLWRTFVVPRMLYGIETLKITTTDIYKLEQFQKKDPSTVFRLATTHS